MMREARWHSLSMAPARSRTAPGSTSLVRSSWADIRIVDSGLFSSWATPDRSVPSAFSLSAWMSWSCVCCSSRSRACSSA